ncbi:MAG: DUF2461 domain-containing protein [Anaerolineales bacterium]|nr:DUF2461 domain-containing protein [Anaerolineales bacterium]
MGLKPELFKFLRELKINNNRDWFQANKSRYEKDVKNPLLQFIADFADRVPEISPHIAAIPRASGGSMFRIYRDIRFSKDKTPYKTAAALHFRHERGKDVHAPGYYLHLEPGSVFMGAGIWKPDGETVTKIRTRIDTKPGEWREAIENQDFISTFSLEGDSLIRPPRGFDPDHPLIEDLKRKDYIGSRELSEESILRDDFIDYYVELCKKSAPLMRFISQSIGLSW